MVDVVTEFAREDALSELLYADDLVLMSETMEGLRNKFLRWKEVFEIKGRKVNIGNTKVMVSAAKHMTACLKIKLTHVGLAA